MITQKFINSLAYKIVDFAIEVHKQLGSDLLESVYEACLVYKLKSNNLKVDQHLVVTIFDKGKKIKQN